MRRVRDDFPGSLANLLPLTKELKVLEIGSGDGARSRALAEQVGTLVGVEPDETKLSCARAIRLANTEFKQGQAEQLPELSCDFDFAFFPLSLHHVPERFMDRAITNASAHVRQRGHVVFLEPTMKGSFFDAEVQFGICDGDERLAKSMAYHTMLRHKKLGRMQESFDYVRFAFQSVEDFVSLINPARLMRREAEDFILRHDLWLWAKRRINVFELS